MMNLKYCGVVDTEDGLLLLGDAAALQEWPGSEDEPTVIAPVVDAEQKELFGMNVPALHEAAAIWNLEGPGTSDIFQDETLDRITIVRSWPADDDSDEEEAIRQLGAIPAQLDTLFAEFVVDCGTLAMMSPLESGVCILGSEDTGFSLSSEEMMTEASGLLVSVTNGRYQCFHDRVQVGENEARRCHLIRIKTTPDHERQFP